MPYDLAKSLEIRECNSGDACTLAVIGSATLLEAFAGFIPGDSLLTHCRNNHNPEAYTAFFAQPETRAWLAEVSPGAAPVGYALLTVCDFPAALVQAGDLELRRIYLFSRFHGTGAAHRMMDLAIAAARQQDAPRLLLGVHLENHRAVAFYRKKGFLEIGVRHFQVGSSRFEDPVFALNL